MHIGQRSSRAAGETPHPHRVSFLLLNIQRKCLATGKNIYNGVTSERGQLHCRKYCLSSATGTTGKISRLKHVSRAELPAEAPCSITKQQHNVHAQVGCSELQPLIKPREFRGVVKEVSLKNPHCAELQTRSL